MKEHSYLFDGLLDSNFAVSFWISASFFVSDSSVSSSMRLLARILSIAPGHPLLFGLLSVWHKYPNFGHTNRNTMHAAISSCGTCRKAILHELMTPSLL